VHGLICTGSVTAAVVLELRLCLVVFFMLAEKREVWHGSCHFSGGRDGASEGELERCA